MQLPTHHACPLSGPCPFPPQVLARHRRRWPGAHQTVTDRASTPQQQQQPQGDVAPTIEAAAAAVGLSPEPALDPLNPYDDPTCTPQHQVHVVRVMEEQLAALVPSLEGDESAGHVAVLRTLPVQVGDRGVGGGGGSWWMGIGPC